MPWIAPKTNWVAADGVLNTDMNRIEANLLELYNTKAPLASPTFTGDPKSVTPAITDNDTTIATTAYVRGQEIKGQVTVTNASWVASGNTRFPFKKNAPITGAVAADKPISFDFTLATYEIAETAGISYVECYAGGITLFAKTTPTGSVIADYVIRKA